MLFVGDEAVAEAVRKAWRDVGVLEGVCGVLKGLGSCNRSPDEIRPFSDSSYYD